MLYTLATSQDAYDECWWLHPSEQIVTFTYSEAQRAQLGAAKMSCDSISRRVITGKTYLAIPTLILIFLFTLLTCPIKRNPAVHAAAVPSAARVLTDDDSASQDSSCFPNAFDDYDPQGNEADYDSSDSRFGCSYSVPVPPRSNSREPPPPPLFGANLGTLGIFPFRAARLEQDEVEIRQLLRVTSLCESH